MSRREMPFLYRVASGSSSAGKIGPPLRDVASSQKPTPVQLSVLTLFGCATAAFANSADAQFSSTSIFAPASTPAKTIFGLSLFVLVVTGLIFVVVATLLAYATVKFRARGADADREPAQVYGSTQIELHGR